MDEPIYRIIEKNVDGCGSDAEEFIRASRPMTEDELKHLSRVLAATKRLPGDNSTSDMIEIAISDLGIEGLTLVACAPPFAGDVSF